MAEYSRIESGEPTLSRDRGCLFDCSDAIVEPESGCSPGVALSKKLLSEFVGSFILVIAAAGSAIINDETKGGLGVHGLSAAPAAAVAAMILATGHISGAHINPAVTLAFATLRHFPWVQVPLYIICQVVAAISASFLVNFIYDPLANGSSGGVTVPVGSFEQSLVFEIVLTAMLMFVITSVATDTRAVGELAGLAVALTVYMDCLIAVNVSGASMNPIRTLGPAVASGNFKGLWIYIVGPIVGAQIGAGLYTLIRFKDQEKQRRKTFASD